MFFDYDPTDDNSGFDFATLASSAGAVVSQLYMPCSLPYAPRNTVLAAHRYYCSGDPNPDRLSDCAHLWVRTTSTANTQGNLGRLMIDYQVDLYDPEPPGATTAPATKFKQRKGNTPAGSGISGNTIIGTIDKVVTTTQEAFKQGLYMVGNVTEVINAVSKASTAASTVSEDTPMGLDIPFGFHPDSWWDDAVSDAGFVPDDTLYFQTRAAGLNQIKFTLTTAFLWTPIVDGAGPQLHAVLYSNWYFDHGYMLVTSDYPRYPVGQVCSIIFNWSVTLGRKAGASGDPKVTCYCINPTQGTFAPNPAVDLESLGAYFSFDPDLRHAYPVVDYPNLNPVPDRAAATVSSSISAPSSYISLANVDKAVAAAQALVNRTNGPSARASNR